MNVKGKRGRPKKKDGLIRLRMMCGLLMYAYGMWKVKTSGDLGQGLPTAKSWEKGKGEKEEEEDLLDYT